MYELMTTRALNELVRRTGIALGAAVVAVVAATAFPIVVVETQFSTIGNLDAVVVVTAGSYLYRADVVMAEVVSGKTSHSRIYWSLTGI